MADMMNFWEEYEKDTPNRAKILRELGFPKGLNDEFERMAMKFYKLGAAQQCLHTDAPPAPEDDLPTPCPVCWALAPGGHCENCDKPK